MDEKLLFLSSIASLILNPYKMKKFIIHFIIALLCISNFYAQSFNKEVILNTTPMLLGKINKEALTASIYKEWFLKEHNAYNPKQKTLDSIADHLDSYTIKIFMGTWCGDSKREVPRFYKVIENLEFSSDRITVIAVNNQRDEYKQSPGGEHEGITIHRVPTFVFTKREKK